MKTNVKKRMSNSSFAPGNDTSTEAPNNGSSSSVHPGTVAGASIGGVLIFLILLIVVLFLVVYFRFPQKLVKWLLNLQLRASGLRRKSIISSTDGFEFHYAERGRPSLKTDDSEPSVLLIHGFSDSVTAWSPVVKEIPGDIHVVAIDLPGHGRSVIRDRDDLSLSGITLKVHEFVVAIGLDKTPGGIHVIGHSLGGAIAGNYGATYGRLDGVRLVTLACPAMKTPTNSEFWDAVQRGEFEHWLIPETPEGTSLMLSRTCQTMDEVQLKRGKQLVKGLTTIRAKKNENYRKVWKAWEPEIANSETIVAGWASIDRPTQLVWGAHDRIIDKSGADVLIKVLPDAQVDILPEAGHSFNIEAPKDFANLICKFRKDKKKSLSSKMARDHLLKDDDSDDDDEKV